MYKYGSLKMPKALDKNRTAVMLQVCCKEDKFLNIESKL